MSLKSVTYQLEIYELPAGYSSPESLSPWTPLFTFMTEDPFGPFHVGDTVAHIDGLRHLGKIRHVHHTVGDYGEEQVLHITALYLSAEG